MNFEQHDIQQSEAYLLTLLQKGTLIVGVDKINEFVDFIANNTTAKLLKESLLLTIKALTIAELKNLEGKYLKYVEFDNMISKSFHLEKRIHLKQKLIQLDSEIGKVSLEETIAKAFRIEKRVELKQKLIKLEIESKNKEPKVISIKFYLKAISIAASIILIFLVWQPQHASDNQLFVNYSSNLDNNTINDYTNADLIKEQSGLRGGEEHFRNYSYNETLELLGAIALVKLKDFEKAKKIFNRLHVEKEKNPGLALYLSIAQVNSGNLNNAIMNLEYLIKLSGFLYQDETKFHLAFAYLKSGEREKAKKVLHDLVISKSKYSEHAQQTLKQIRWF